MSRGLRHHRVRQAAEGEGRLRRVPALLLLGPTGSGKTPTGDLLEREGLGGRRCHHFDFGRRLRETAAGDPACLSSGLSGDEVRVIRSVLESGALLEDEQFPIAEKILRGFLAERHLLEPEILILNGLPRHVGQAGALEPIVRVEWVLRLVCEPRVVLERIRCDSGGDRRGRPDDDEELVRGKLESYRLRTEPLVGYYRERGAVCRDVRVGVPTRAVDVRRDLLDAFG